jgi:WXG100 family type VII secretion target
MTLIKVTAEDLQTLSSQVNAGSASIQEQLSQLQAQVMGVVGGDWMGVASGAFNEKYEEWNTSAAGLRDALDGIGVLLARAATTYQSTEDQIRASMT